MAAAESVSTAEGNDLLIVEAHSVEDVTDVLGALGSIGKTAVGSAGREVTVSTAGPVRNLRSQHLLDGADTTEDPEIRVGDPGELLCSDC